jgi:hypothetical protein
MGPHQHESLLAEYEAAIALERATWTVARDETVKPQERVVAYARWRKAAERVKVLADQMLEGGGNASQPGTPGDA